jgi:hypothetical protein
MNPLGGGTEPQHSRERTDFDRFPEHFLPASAANQLLFHPQAAVELLAGAESWDAHPPQQETG